GAMFSAALFALLYLLIRNRTVGVSVLVLVVFILMSSFVRSRVVESASGATAGVLPAHRDWVDQANPGDGVALVAGPGASDLAVLETAFNNLSISRVYYVCKPAFGSVFGEQRIWADRAGGLHDAAGYLSAASVVVPAGLGVQGRVVARNPKGHLVLVAPLNGRVRAWAAV